MVLGDVGEQFEEPCAIMAGALHGISDERNEKKGRRGWCMEDAATAHGSMHSFV